MARSDGENTAINRLIASIRERRVTTQWTAPTIPELDSEIHPLPVQPEGTPVPGTTAQAESPSSDPQAWQPWPEDATLPGTPVAAPPAPWRPSSTYVVARQRPAQPDWLAAERAAKPSQLRSVLRVLALPIALLVVGGLVIGGYVSERSEPAAAQLVPARAAPSATSAAKVVSAAAPAISTPAPVAMVAALPAPIVAPAPLATAAPAPAAKPAAPAPVAEPGELVNVRIESIPSGATVTLVDRGRPQLVGSTPIDVAVDPTRGYDVLLSDPEHPDLPSRLEHFDPQTTRRVSVALAPATPVAPDPPKRPEHADAPKHHRERRAEADHPPVEADHSRSETEHPRVEADRAHAETGTGTLMLSSKPPCEIFVDDDPTGLMTPQRALSLSAGRHKITLVNHDSDTKKTFTVQITAGGTEKVIQDLMK